jgi:hypothetical protein
MHRFASLLAQISHPGLGFEVGKEDRNYFLRVVCKDTTDNTTGEAHAWKGRKWRLSTHMTDGEVVQTAFLATMAAIEHETRERFRYKGVSVFDPHYDIDKLVALRSQPDALRERAHGPAAAAPHPAHSS